MNHREIKTRDLLLFCVLLENTGHSSGVKSFILGHYLTYIVPPSQVLIIMCIGRFRVSTLWEKFGCAGRRLICALCGGSAVSPSFGVGVAVFCVCSENKSDGTSLLSA